MILRPLLLGAAIAAALVSPALPQSSGGIPGVIAPGVEVELVQEGYQFTEGPVGTPDGGLYFTDNRANKILLLDRKSKITAVHENTNNANGLVLTKSGDLLEVQGAGKRVNRRSRDGKVTTLTESVGGQPFMAPNDLIADAKGGIYFTDPGPRPVVAGRKAYVYYLPPGAKEPVVIDDAIVRPNGLSLTLDGKTLIVDDSVGDEVFAWDVQRDGAVKNKRTLLKLHDISAALLCDDHRRASVRRQGSIPRHDQNSPSADQRGVCRVWQAHALHHGARGALPDQDFGARAETGREIIKRWRRCSTSAGRRRALRPRRPESG
jgi:hypothetical protein